jgi:hypothetical protein
MPGVNRAVRKHAALAGLLAATLVAAASAAEAQVATSTTEQVVLGAGGYALNFNFQWSCDDVVGGTTSSPGRIDLVDAGGTTIGQVAGTVAGGVSTVGAPVVGALSNVSCSVASEGAGGTPADGLLRGTWRISGVAPGPYTVRFWEYVDSISGRVGTTITTVANDAGGSGPILPPNVTLSAPQAATAFLPVVVGATASEGPNGNPLASVVVDVSMDAGATWSPVLANAQAASPSDTEKGTTTPAQAGTATLRATVTDSVGLQSTAEQVFAVAKASQAPVAISPTALSLTAGESAAFTASGGTTGNYAWSGSAAGSGPTQSVTFPSPGTYSLSVLDAGDANHNPSAPAIATVSVQAAFFVLSVTTGPGGTVAGGGSYPPNSQANAVATAGPGETFAGWTGDVTGSAPILSVLMNSNKSVTANFASLLPQTITFAAPGTVTTRTPPLVLLATASSGLPVTLVLDSGPASLAGSVLTPSGATGQVTLTATQSGNAEYLPAPPATVSFPIGSPPAGVLLTDDSATTKRSDKYTRTTSYRSGPAQ